MCNAEGISKEDVNKLQTELRKMAADLVGEVSYTYVLYFYVKHTDSAWQFLHCSKSNVRCLEVITHTF